MSHCYSTSFAHLMLSGTSTWCLYLIDDQSFNLAHLALYMISLNSSIGVTRWAISESEDESMGQSYRLSLHIQNLTSLPLFTAEMFVKLGYEPKYSIIQTFVPIIIPEILNKFNPMKLDESINKLVTDALVTVNCLSLMTLSKIHGNHHGMAAAAIFWFNYFVVSPDTQSDETFLTVPLIDWYTYWFCLFTYTATVAIVEASENV